MKDNIIQFPHNQEYFQEKIQDAKERGRVAEMVSLYRSLLEIEESETILLAYFRDLLEFSEWEEGLNFIETHDWLPFSIQSKEKEYWLFYLEFLFLGQEYQMLQEELKQPLARESKWEKQIADLQHRLFSAIREKKKQDQKLIIDWQFRFEERIPLDQMEQIKFISDMNKLEWKDQEPLIQEVVKIESLDSHVRMILLDRWYQCSSQPSLSIQTKEGLEVFSKKELLPIYERSIWHRGCKRLQELLENEDYYFYKQAMSLFQEDLTLVFPRIEQAIPSVEEWIKRRIYQDEFGQWSFREINEDR